jgi:hypothetical protein
MYSPPRRVSGWRTPPPSGSRCGRRSPDSTAPRYAAQPGSGSAGVQVLHITGPRHAVQVPDGDPAGPPYVVIPYVKEMQYAYAENHVIGQRAVARRVVPP